MYVPPRFVHSVFRLDTFLHTLFQTLGKDDTLPIPWFEVTTDGPHVANAHIRDAVTGKTPVDVNRPLVLFHSDTL